VRVLRPRRPHPQLTLVTATIVSLSLVSVPNVLLNKTQSAVLAAFRQSLVSAVKIVIPIAPAAALSHAANAYIHRGTSRAPYFAVAAVTTVGFVPFTQFFIGWINAELFQMLEKAKGTEQGVEPRTLELIRKWKARNSMRGVFPAVAAVVACAAL
jgi:hypothetical protein